LTTTVIGVLIVSIPITRRLGRVLEEWVQIRREGAPDRAAVDSVLQEIRSLSRHVEALDDRLQILADRQDFTESLVEARPTGTKALPPEA
ncbi:MAG: hypothetical protein OEM96_09370, partial [Gemmatimonadota bacterium]|nr:hypothetical protein [Gemmatimonadota bacterium]